MKTNKRLFFLLLALLLTVSAMPLSALPARAGVVKEGECGKYVTYVLFDDGSLKIKGKGRMEYYDPRWQAPWGDVVTSVTIENGVENVGDYAFYGCENLTSVSLPESILGIGSFSFAYCSKLVSIDLPDSLHSISYDAFYWCAGLTSVSVPESVTYIGSAAFKGCSALASIDLPDGMEGFGGDVFTNTAWYDAQPDGPLYAGNYLCGYKGEIPENLTLTVNNGCLGIADGVFQNCGALVSAAVPAGVRFIGNNAFEGCTALTDVSMEKGLYKIGSHAFEGCTALTDVSMEKGLRNIDYRAFFGCALTAVSLPETVEFIGVDAFKNCNQIVSLSVADGNPFYHSSGNCIINTEEKELYIGCKTSVIPGDGSVTQIGMGAFSGCSGLTSISIPEGVTVISLNAFSGCENLASVSFPNGLKEIWDSAFCECISLRSVSFPDSLKRIGSHAFENCVMFTSVLFPNGLEKIGDSAFEGCLNISEITIPDSVITLGGAFPRCISLESVTIGNGVRSIGSYAFSACGRLKTVSIPDSVTEIGSHAFEGCSSLAVASVGNNVKDIPAHAFSRCSSLVTVVLGRSVKWIGYQAFYNCNKLSNVVFHSNPVNSQSIWNGTVSVEIGNDRLKAASVSMHGPFLTKTVREATCTEAGEGIRYCTFCGYESNTVSLPAPGHDWSDWAQSPAPTCEAPGEEKRVCARCFAESTRSLAPLGHAWSGWNETSPTCGADGVKTRECTRCRKEESVVLPATGNHHFSEWKTVKDPTCAEGLMYRACTVCGRSESLIIEPISEHTWGWVTDQAPACGAPGIKHEECAVCGAVRSENTPIPALADAHDFSAKKAEADYLAAPATCIAPASYYVSCVFCGAADYDHTFSVGAPDPVNGHVWSRWAQTLAPGCETPGEETRYCVNCSAEEKRKVDPIGHEWGDPVYEWSDDYAVCTAKVPCKHDPAHVALSETAKSESKTTATCTEDGERIYTVGFRNKRFWGQTATVFQSALGHDWDEWTPVPGEPGREQRVCKNDPAHVETREISVLMGDVDGDGFIQPGDARLALRISLGLMKDGDTDMTPEMVARADVDGKDGVQPADARLILRKSLGLTDKEWVV